MPLWRCQLCGFERWLTGDSQARQATCPSCGLDLKQAVVARPRLISAAAATTDGSTDPLDRWLSGEAIPVKSRSGWEHVTLWTRRHPRLSALAGVIVLALIGMVAFPIGTLVAQRAALKNAVSRKVVELEMQEDRWKSQQQERQQLEGQLQQLKASYEKSQQQCTGADQRLQDALRESRMSLAQELSVQAVAIRKKLPETSLLLA